jgi:Helix-turn-helix of DDE superfamily endonuclease/DDE superfamily endonuclease
MIRYDQLKEKPKQFLAATGLTVAEFQQILPVFTEKLAALHPPELTKRGTPRQRQAGAGPKGNLRTYEDKLLFILVYQKTYPIQEMLGLQFEISQPQANHWIHLLLPILKQTLSEMGLTPERDSAAVAENPLVAEAEPDFLLDGTERRRQRPKDAQKQREHYSGKKKTHTDKNLLLVSNHTKKVLYLSPTAVGKTHDKRMADDHPISYPRCSTLGKDTGFQGYEPKDVITFQPKKT